MSKLAKHQKDFISQQVYHAGMIKYGPVILDGSSCLYFMELGLTVLERSGIRCIPACGTARFQMRKYVEGEDKPTHLSFEWNTPSGGEYGEAKAAPISRTATALPEMHCFIFLPDTQEIVDFSTRSIPRFAERIGFKFEPEFVPPTYYWEHPAVLHPVAMYIPNVDATKLAIKILKQQHYEPRSKQQGVNH